MPSPEDIERYVENWQGEIDGASSTARWPRARSGRTSPTCTASSPRSRRSTLLSGRSVSARLAASRGRAAPSWRARTLAWVARRFGAETVLPTVATGEYADRNVVRRATRDARDGDDGRGADARATPREPPHEDQDGRRGGDAWSARGAPQGRRRQRVQGGRARRERRALLEPQPRDGDRGGDDRSPRDRDDGPRRAFSRGRSRWRWGSG